MFRLRIEGGPRNGESISLAPGKTLVVGRGRECDVRFPEDATMSRVQGELTWDGSAWTVHNKSQHGTLVGGQRVDTNKVLTPGDQLVFGGTRVTYEADPSGAPTMAPRPAPAGAAGGNTGNTPPPMPRDVAAKDPNKETATPAGATPAGATPAGGKPAAGKPATPAKPGAPGSKNKLIIGVIALLFGCCCFGNIFYFFVLPRILAR